MSAPATPSPTTSKPKPVMTYWQLVKRDFIKNRLSVLGSIIIVFVILIAVFCPLLANQRPLYLHAVLKGDFRNSILIAVEQVGKFAKLDPADEKAVEARKLFDQKLDDAVDMLGPDDHKKADALRAEALAFESDKAAPEKVKAVQDGLKALREAPLQPVTRFPAFRALVDEEIYAFFALGVFILLLLMGGKIRGVVPKFLVLVIVPGVLLFIVRTAYPQIEDLRNYRTIVEARDFTESGGKVVRTIVPYGENESIKEERTQWPTWLMLSDADAAKMKAEYETAEAKKPEAERKDWDAPSRGRMILPTQHNHLLGTDTLGRDVLARMMYGARVSMLVGIFGVSIYTFIGIVLGATAGFFRGWVDIGISRLTEIVICFPALMLILSVQAFLEPSLLNIIYALALLWWTSVERLQRAEFLRLSGLDFVQAVRALGGSNLRIIFVHILPNALGPILVLTSFGIAGSILIESGLSFLGFGVPQPMASWGQILNEGRADIRGNWWLTVFPGITIFLTVTCFNLIGEGVRDALDPRRDK